MGEYISIFPGSLGAWMTNEPVGAPPPGAEAGGAGEAGVTLPRICSRPRVLEAGEVGE